MSQVPRSVRIRGLWNKLRRSERLYAEGMANYAGRDLWYLFYDVDGNPASEEKRLQKYYRLHSWANSSLENWEIYETKHGYQLRGWEESRLEDIRAQFGELRSLFGGDYFFSIPLWLRIGNKFNEWGEERSTPPILRAQSRECIRGRILIRKLYATWD